MMEVIPLLNKVWVLVISNNITLKEFCKVAGVVNHSEVVELWDL